MDHVFFVVAFLNKEICFVVPPAKKGYFRPITKSNNSIKRSEIDTSSINI